MVAPDTFTLTHRQAILAFVAQHGVPALHAYREAVVEYRDAEFATGIATGRPSMSGCGTVYATTPRSKNTNQTGLNGTKADVEG